VMVRVCCTCVCWCGVTNLEWPGACNREGCHLLHQAAITKYPRHALLPFFAIIGACFCLRIHSRNYLYYTERCMMRIWLGLIGCAKWGVR
jgi:hypothetical protein